MLARALPVTASRSGAAVVVRIGPVVAGHRVPTGDPFHQIRFSLRVLAAGGALIAERELMIRRDPRTDIDGGAASTVTEADNRLFPGETREVILDVGSGAGESVSLEVTGTYLRIPEIMSDSPYFPKDLPTRLDFISRRLTLGAAPTTR
jgi:hypothetical protein